MQIWTAGARGWDACVVQSVSAIKALVAAVQQRHQCKGSVVSSSQEDGLLCYSANGHVANVLEADFLLSPAFKQGLESRAFQLGFSGAASIPG